MLIAGLALMVVSYPKKGDGNACLSVNPIRLTWTHTSKDLRGDRGSGAQANRFADL